MFTRIEPQHAGPDALGILVPPGARTLVIVRPRSLQWDLLPARWNGDHGRAPEFCTFTRDEAAGVARQLIAELQSATANPFGTLGNPEGTCVQIWLRTKDIVWIVCRREPGRGYEPMNFSSQEDAINAADSLTPIFWPPAGTSQRYYFNTQGFS